MVCLIKHFPQERKEAAACGMQRLITNSEPLFNFRLLSFFFLVAALSSVMACFVVFCALEGSSEETECESSLGIFHSHLHPRISVSSLQITLFMESLSLFCYLSLSCQSLQRPRLLHVSVHISGMSAPFKAVPSILVCIHRLQISLLYFKNSTFSWKCCIWRWKYYSHRSILHKGEKDERECRKGERNKENKENDQVEFCFQVQTADLLQSSFVEVSIYFYIFISFQKLLLKANQQCYSIGLCPTLCSQTEPTLLALCKIKNQGLSPPNGPFSLLPFWIIVPSLNYKVSFEHTAFFLESHWSLMIWS